MDLSNIVRSDAKLDTRQKASIALRLSAPAMMAQISSIAMQYIDAAIAERATFYLRWLAEGVVIGPISA